MAESREQINNHAGFIWSVADLLRGDYKQSEYGRVILPLTVLRRLDCVLGPVKPRMLEMYEQVKGKVGNASSSPTPRLPRSSASTAISRRATRSRSSPTRHSDSSASPSSGRSK